MHHTHKGQMPVHPRSINPLLQLSANFYKKIGDFTEVGVGIDSPVHAFFKLYYSIYLFLILRVANLFSSCGINRQL
jgi:hypothetical protein